MKSESPTSAIISNAVLASRYLALQELREKVRRAEELFASARVRKTSFVQPDGKSETSELPNSRN